jgi:hypothetical protein
LSGRHLISLLLPTRKRPALVQRFLRSVQETASYPDDIEIVLYVDDDDVTSHELAFPGLRLERIIGPRQSMGGYNTACLARARGNIIVLVNDDVVIRSAGWDEALRRLDAAVPDGIYLAYGDDMFKSERLCTFPILSRRGCEILQEPYHHAYRGAFIDYHLMDIFKRLEHSGHKRIFYLPEIVFEHLHYRTGKSEVDETYTARGRFEDDMLFVGLAPVRAASERLLIDAITGKSGAGDRLPVFTPVRRPKTIFHAAWLFARVFLADRALPAQWRFFMWWWFTARYLASSMLKQPARARPAG